MTYHPESERDPPNNPIMPAAEKPMTTELAERLREALRSTEPEAYCDFIALCWQHRETILAALSPSPAPGVETVELVASRVFPILWQAECYNGVTLEDVDQYRIGGHYDMGGRVEQLEVRSLTIARAALSTLSTEGVEEDFYAGRYAERCGDVAMRDAEIKELRSALTKAMRELGNAVEIDPQLRGLADYDECVRIAKSALERGDHTGGGNG